MQESNKAIIQDRMILLRRKYLAQLHERRPQITDFITACAMGGATEEICAQMRQSAHNFAGSGASYGFAYISQTAADLESALDNQASTPELRALTQALLDSCNRALSMIDSMPKFSSVAELSALEQLSHQFKPVILTVDDDTVIRDLVVELFKREAEVMTSNNGAKALNIIRHHGPQLVLVDDGLADMRGIELLEIVKKDPAIAKIPVIMLTANNKAVDMKRAREIGAIDYITKPFELRHLAEKVAPILKNLNRTVLIADNDMAILDLFTEKFKGTGVRLLLAKNGLEAVDLIRQNKIKLALLDWMMPGMDGPAVLQKIRGNPDTKNIPVLFLTSKRKETDIKKAYALGATGYIVKPFIPDQVVARSLKLLGLADGAANQS